MIHSDPNRSMRLLAVAVMSMLVMACGGGGSDASSGTDGSTAPSPAAGNTASPAPAPASGSTSTTTDLPGDFGASQASLDTAYGRLAHADPAADATAMLAAAQALPAVQSATLTDATTVAIVYKDGTSHILSTQPYLSLAEAAADPTATPAAVPTGTRSKALDAALPDGTTAGPTQGGRAVVATMLTWNWSNVMQSLGDPVGTIRAWLGPNPGQNYAVNDNTLFSPNDLASLTNASVLYLEAHGAHGSYQQAPNQFAPVFVLTTPLLATKENLAYYPLSHYLTQDGATAPELAFFTTLEPFKAADGSVKYHNVTYIGITPQFVRNRVSFSGNSLAFINACALMKANDAYAADMVQAFLDKGATNVIGWSDSAVITQAVDSALFLFDRLLGSNAYPAYAATPPNRPFSVPLVLAAMSTQLHQPAAQPSDSTYYVVPRADVPLNTSYNVRQDPTNPDNKIVTLAKLTLASAPNAKALALAPSINGLTLSNNSNTLTLTGDFGDSAANGTVTVGDGTSPQTVSSWSSGRIVIDNLPQSAGGLVTVTVSGARSNQALLSQWNGVPLTMKTYNGSNERDVTCAVNLRASFDTFRQRLSGTADGTPNSAAVYTDNAVLQSSGPCSFVAMGNPSGGGSLPWWNQIGAAPGDLPSSGANVFSTVTPDNAGGGSITLSMQAIHSDPSLGFLDTSATTGAGAQIAVDPASQAFPGGIATQFGGGSVLDTLSWGATSPSSPSPAGRAR